MSVAQERTLERGLSLYEELADAVDDRTLEILEQRRRNSIVRDRGWLVRRMLLLGDITGLLVAFTVAELVFGRRGGIAPTTELLLFVATLPGWVVLTKLYGLYDNDQRRADHWSVDDAVGVFHVVSVGAWLFAVGAWITGFAHPDLAKLATFWAAAIVLVLACRVAARTLCRRSIKYLQNTVIVGAGDVGQAIARKLLQHPEYGINLIGFVDANPKERGGGLGHLAILGPPEKLQAITRLLDVERVIIAFSNDTHEQTLDLIRSLKDEYVQVDIVPRLFEILGSGIGVHSVEGVPLVGLPPLRLSRSSALLKRVLDVGSAAVALPLLLPFFVLIAVAIKIDSAGPVFFRQTRRGVNGRTFTLYKFRTMIAEADERKREVSHLNRHARDGGDPRMFKIVDDPRVTRVGRFLRHYFVDELPQLINVLKGDMSLVGPRPLILEEDEHVSDWARKRLDLKPGMTGIWQVLGRNEISFEEMVRLDYIYVTTWSLWNDSRLLLRTIPLVLRGDGGSY